MDRLTDADRKWILTAEYGGTGGIPMEQGMVVEEPDIEIGAGVSSKGNITSLTSDSYRKPINAKILDSNQQTYANRQRRSTGSSQ